MSNEQQARRVCEALELRFKRLHGDDGSVAFTMKDGSVYDGELEAWLLTRIGWILDRLDAANQRADAAEAMATRWKKAVEGLTPNGSEFVNDPEFCAKYIREELVTTPRMMLRLKEENAALATELAEFRQRENRAGDTMYWIAEHDKMTAKLGVAEAEERDLRRDNAALRAELAQLREERYVNQRPIVEGK